MRPRISRCTWPRAAVVTASATNYENCAGKRREVRALTHAGNAGSGDFVGGVDARVLFSDPDVRAEWSRRHEASKTTAANLVRDIRAYLDHLGNARCAVIGYCMGGRLALLAAATYPERVVAVAAYHPGRLVTDEPDSPHLQLGRIRGRVYIGAASDDPTLTDEQRRVVADALTAGGVDHAVELYPARHGWVPSDTPVHDAAATERHWETLLGLLGRALR